LNVVDPATCALSPIDIRSLFPSKPAEWVSNSMVVRNGAFFFLASFVVSPQGKLRVVGQCKPAIKYPSSGAGTGVTFDAVTGALYLFQSSQNGASSWMSLYVVDPTTCALSPIDIRSLFPSKPAEYVSDSMVVRNGAFFFLARSTNNSMVCSFTPSTKSSRIVNFDGAAAGLSPSGTRLSLAIDSRNNVWFNAVDPTNLNNKFAVGFNSEKLSFSVGSEVGLDFAWLPRFVSGAKQPLFTEELAALPNGRGILWDPVDGSRSIFALQGAKACVANWKSRFFSGQQGMVVAATID